MPCDSNSMTILEEAKPQNVKGDPPPGVGGEREVVKPFYMIQSMIDTCHLPKPIECATQGFP